MWISNGLQPNRCKASRTTTERFALIHRVMLHAPFLLARALLPGMYAAGWGRIVHVSSVHGHRASPYKSAYVSAKHGLEGLSKVIALEAADKGVTSNTVCPGYVRTPLVEGQIADQATSHGIAEDEVLDNVLLARTPDGFMVLDDRVGHPMLAQSNRQFTPVLTIGEGKSWIHGRRVGGMSLHASAR